MATVYIPFQCRRFTGGKGVVAAGGTTIEELFSDLEKSYPGIMATIRDDGGEVRRYISVFANNEDIRHLENLATPVGETDEISIVSAIAGGMSAKVMDRTFPPIPSPARMPFHYASLSAFWLFYRVRTATAEAFTADTGLMPAVFDGRAVAVLNFQRFTVHGPIFTGTNTLIECSVLAYPGSQEARVPAGLSFAEFLAGEEQTKLIGHFRLHVPSDNHYGVAGRQELWGLSTFYTTFEFMLPCLNYPETRTWSLTCKDPEGNGAILSIEAEFPSSPELVPANISPIVQYSVLNKKLVSLYLNLAGPAQTFHLDGEAQSRIKLTLGKSSHPMRSDVGTLIGDSPVAAVQRFESPPAAVEGRGVFVDRA